MSSSSPRSARLTQCDDVAKASERLAASAPARPRAVFSTLKGSGATGPDETRVAAMRAPVHEHDRSGAWWHDSPTTGARVCARSEGDVRVQIFGNGQGRDVSAVDALLMVGTDSARALVDVLGPLCEAVNEGAVGVAHRMPYQASRQRYDHPAPRSLNARCRGCGAVRVVGTLTMTCRRGRSAFDAEHPILARIPMDARLVFPGCGFR